MNTAPYPWQQTQWQRIQSMHQQGRIPHALLFMGPEGVGKRHFAEALAQALLCEKPEATGQACGRCGGCALYKAETHSDLKRLEPEAPSKTILVDTIREFTQSEGLSSQSGGYKITLIDPADAMNLSASNALLKTLEEPTQSALIILIGSRLSGLSATIRSRCQLLGFPTPAPELALSWLQAQGGEGAWPNLLAAAAGAPLKALNLSRQETGLAERGQCLGEISDLFAGKADPIMLAETWFKGDVAVKLEWLLNVIVDILRLSANTGYDNLFNPDRRDHLIKLAASKPPSQWHRLAEAVIQTKMAISRQLNMQLQLETLLLLMVGGPVNKRGDY